MKCLTDEEKLSVEKESTTTTLPKGQLVFTENGIPFGVYILLSGKLKLYKTGNTGKKHIFQLCVKNDLFGLHPVLKDSKYPDSAELLEDSELLFIPAFLIKKLLKENNNLCLTILKVLSTEFERFIEQEVMFSQKSVAQRVSTVLFYLSRLYEVDNRIIIPLSRNDLSDLCGTVKETLVRVLHDLKEDKLLYTIDSKGTLEIVDLARLKSWGEIVEKEFNDE